MCPQTHLLINWPLVVSIMIIYNRTRKERINVEVYIYISVYMNIASCWLLFLFFGFCFLDKSFYLTFWVFLETLSHIPSLKIPFKRWTTNFCLFLSTSPKPEPVSKNISLTCIPAYTHTTTATTIATDLHCFLLYLEPIQDNCQL